MNIEILINKDNKLDKNFIPNNLVNYINKEGNKIYIKKCVLDNFLKLKRYSLLNNINLDIQEGYRSYNEQIKVLKECIKEKGEDHAYKYVALPGTSEHQSGLAIDIYIYINNKSIFEYELNNLKEIKWLHNNIHKFGFILRYPKGKEDITLYNYEPWHFRYVGKNLANIIYNNNLTLEKYYDLYLH